MFARSTPFFRTIIFLVVLLLYSTIIPRNGSGAWQAPKELTVICYMNGDNNLAGEVLHAVDMLETVGSTKDIEILALVDGQPGDNGGYGPSWESTKVLQIEKDDTVGVIQSPVLEDWGEQNLGDAQVLESFLRKCSRYPSERYIFLLFAHGRGIIDTQSFTTPSGYKSLFISPDDSGERAMNHPAFSQAIEKGLGGAKFDLMLFFSCLANMVEIGYELRDLTNYIIGSEDEIRLVNTPQGSYQIRGIEAEKLVAQLAKDLHTPTLDLGKLLIDSYIGQYETSSSSAAINGRPTPTIHAATLSLIDCGKYNKLAKTLDTLARYLITSINHDTTGKAALQSIHSSLATTQKYPSFLNLEYYDLFDFLENLAKQSDDQQLRALCSAIQDILQNELVLYEQHTANTRSHGVAIFLPSFLLPENIYQSHLHMYAGSSFARNFSWIKLIETYREQMDLRHGELLLDSFELASHTSNLEELYRLNSKIPWVIQKDIDRGNFTTTARYLSLLESTELEGLRPQSLNNLLNVLSMIEINQQEGKALLSSVKAMLAL